MPYLLDRPGLGHHVQGEVYQVDDDMLALLGTIHILRKHLYNTKLNLTSKFFTKTRFFRQNKIISFSTLHFDKIFML